MKRRFTPTELQQFCDYVSVNNIDTVDEALVKDWELEFCDRKVMTSPLFYVPMRIISLLFLIPLILISFQYSVLKNLLLICYNQILYGGEYLVYEKNYTIKESFDKIQKLLQ